MSVRALLRTMAGLLIALVVSESIRAQERQGVGIA